MSLENQFEKNLGNNEIYFNVDSDNLKKNIEFIVSRKIENINLNPYKGYKLNNIDWVESIAHIKRLEMGACTKIDLHGLSKLPLLEELVFTAEEKKQKADLSNLKKIKTLSFGFNENIIGLENLEKLESLSVWSANASFLNEKYFEKYKKLSFLMLVQLKASISLEFLKGNHLLEELEIQHCKTEIDLTGLEKLKDNFKKLKITSSKKIKNIELISKLKNLQSLILVDAVPIENVDLIKNLPHLDTLSLYGSSAVNDGNLQELKNQFKNLNIQPKKHYQYPEWYKK